MFLNVGIENATDDSLSKIFQIFRRKVPKEIVLWFSEDFKGGRRVEVLQRLNRLLSTELSL